MMDNELVQAAAGIIAAPIYVGFNIGLNDWLDSSKDHKKHQEAVRAQLNSPERHEAKRAWKEQREKRGEEVNARFEEIQKIRERLAHRDAPMAKFHI